MASTRKATVLSSSSMSKRFAFGVKQKIITLMLAMSVLPVFVLWWVDYTNASAQIERSVDQELQAFVSNRADGIDRFIEENVRAATMAANMPGMLSMNPLVQKPVLQNLHTSYGWVGTAFIADVTGQQTVRDNDVPLSTVRDQPFAATVINGVSPYAVTVLQSDTSGKTSMVVAVPLAGLNTSTQQRQIAGLLALVVPTDVLPHYLGNSDYGQSGFSYILDEQGRVVMHKSASLANRLTDFSQQPVFLSRPKLPGQSTVIGFNDNGEDVVAAIQKSRNGWYYVTQVNASEVYAPLASARKQGFFMLAIFLIIAVAVSVATGNAFSRPIAKIAMVAETIASDPNLMARKYKIPSLGRKDELGELAAAIEKMYLSLKTSMKLLR